MAFETESGLFTNYVGTVTQAYFSPDARKNNGNVLCFFLVMETDDPDNPEHEEIYTCGGDLATGWRSPDGGETAWHPAMERNANKKFNKNSAMGQLIDRVAQIPGAVGELSKHGDEFHARTWVGSRWKMVPVTSSFTNSEGEKVSFDRNFPGEFLGYVDVGTTPTSTNGQTQAASIELADEMKAQLTQLAAENDHASWSRLAMDLLSAEIKSQPQLLTAIGDKNGLYAQLKGV